MTYKAFLVHAEDTRDCEARLRYAAALANRFGAVLVGRAAAQIRLAMGDPYIAETSLLELEQKDVDRELAKAEECFRKVASSVVAGTEWRAGIDLPHKALAADGCGADLLVVSHGAEIERGFYRSIDPGDLVMEAGRAVLVAPRGLAPLKAERVLLAWKNTRETRRAIADAMPFLTGAAEVVVTVVQEGYEGDMTGEEALVAHLRRHGATVSLERIGLQEETVGDEVLARAGQLGVDLIVAGAYGHSRTREWVFGGVTRMLLEHSPVACLLSH